MVKSLREIHRRNLSPRILGFDDTPFQSRPRAPGTPVNSVGIVTTSDRFEGMLYVNNITLDGFDAQQQIREAVLSSKFHEQVHAVMLDGVTMGGFNVIDIQYLSNEIQRPVIAVMRRQPNLDKFLDAVGKLPFSDKRTCRVQAAGPVHCIRHWVFQFRCPSTSLNGGEGDGEGDGDDNRVGDGCQIEQIIQEEETSAEDVAKLLDKCTPAKSTQKIPECLRIAHLVGSAIKTGQSSSSA